MKTKLLLLLLILTSCSKQEQVTISYPHYDIKPFDYELLGYINNYREANNLNDLVMDQFTCDVSYSHSKYMAENKVCNHDGFTERASSFNGRGVFEGVTSGFSTAYGTFNALKNSPPHNAVMLSDTTQIGISNEYDNLGKQYVTIDCVKVNILKK